MTMTSAERSDVCSAEAWRPKKTLPILDRVVRLDYIEYSDELITNLVWNNTPGLVSGVAHERIQPHAIFIVAKGTFRTRGIHAHRVACGNRHHRLAYGPAYAGGAKGARSSL